MTQFNEERLFIYNMGKVGSVSFQVAIRQQGLRSLHGHWIQTEKNEFNTHKLELVKKIQKGDHDDWKVISPIREPMSRNISAFFERISIYDSDYVNLKYRPEMVERFIKNYNYKWPDIWFKEELGKVFKFNPYQEPFDHKAGYHIYDTKYGEVLVIRLEDADRIVPEVFEEFLGLEGVQMAHSNSLANKHGGTIVEEIYTDFLEETKFSSDYLDKVYSLKYAKHFYSENEINQFKERWGK